MQTFSTDHILHTLEQELPFLFQKDLTYEIYSPGIIFQDPINRFQGQQAYRLIFWALRFHRRLFFTHLTFNVHHIRPSDANILVATWTLEGALRLPWHPKIHFTGSSTYTIHQGLITTHTDIWDTKPQVILAQLFKPALKQEK